MFRQREIICPAIAPLVPEFELLIELLPAAVPAVENVASRVPSVPCKSPISRVNAPNNAALKTYFVPAV